MSLRALPAEQVQPTAQSLLAFLDREDVNIPGSLLESIVSGKSLLRALVSGQVVLAQNIEAQPQPQPAEDAQQASAAVKKKAASKKKKAA